MLFGNVNVSALDGTFEMLPKVLQPVHMDVAFCIFVFAVLYGLVLIASATKRAVATHFVSVNRRTLFDVLFNDRQERLLFAVRNDLSHHLPVALQHPEHDCLVGRAAPDFAGPISANIGFVKLDFARQRNLAVHIGHVIADLMTHAPRGLVSHAKLAFQFFRGNSMAGSGEQVDRIEPRLEGSAAVFKRSADSRVQVMTAPLAGVSAFRLDAIPLGLALALRALVILAKANVKQVIQAGFIGRELLEELSHRDARHFSFAL